MNRLRGLGSGGKWLVGVATAAVAVALVPAAGAVVLPADVARSCWFQTNAPDASLDSGDWYTNTGTGTTERLHRFYITIPDGAAFPVTIRVLDAESRVGPAGHDEVIGQRDPTRFELTRPDGTKVTREFKAGAADASVFATVVTAAHGPGTYVLTSETGDGTPGSNDDENAFLVEVTPDGRGTLTRADDVDVSFLQATIACTESRSSLSLRYHVPEGATTTTMRNFDLDSPGRVVGPLEYVAPDGSAVPGTMSANAIWNGPGGDMNQGGDVVPIAPDAAGLWTIVVFGLDASNQVAFEAWAGETPLPLSLTFRPNNVAPTASLHAPDAVDEGAPFAISFLDVTDPDSDPTDLRFFFDCGDTLFQGPLVDPSRECRAGNDGTATVRGSVADGDGGQTDYSATVAVANVPPSYTPPKQRTVPLRPRASVRLGRFADPGPDAPWLAEVDWGDGTAGATRTLGSAGPLPILKHRFPRTGLRSVTVRLTDDHDSVEQSFVLRVRRLCVVPRLVGRKLGAARKAMRNVDCRIGRIRYAPTRRGKVGRVVSQRPVAGKIRPRGKRVNLVVGKPRGAR